MRIALLALLVACKGEPAAERPCTCAPANKGSISSPLTGQPFDGPMLLAQLRRHVAEVRTGKNPRDVKVFDDELRFAIIDYCQPCGSWVSDRSTMDELFPLDKLDQATSAVCMGLVLRDGSTIYGQARPKNCR